MNWNRKRTIILAKSLVVVALVVAIGLVVQAKRDKASQPLAAAKSSSPVPRLVDLGSDKCIPCKMMMPVLKELKGAYAGRLQVDFIDVWRDPDAGKQYKINLIPTQIFYDASGRELFRHEGFFAKDDILAKWKDLGVDLTSGR